MALQSFWSVLKKIGQIGQVAGPIVTSVVPGSGALALLPKLIAALSNGAASTVAVVEATKGALPGAEKMEAAKLAAIGDCRREISQ